MIYIFKEWERIVIFQCTIISLVNNKEFIQIYCHQCGHQIDTDHRIGREEMCPECASPLRCCLNCRFYNAFAHWQCRETEIEYVQDKASGNFCGYFKPSDKFHPPSTRREAAKKKLNDLFKNNGMTKED